MLLALVALVFLADYVVDRNPQLAVKTALLFGVLVVLFTKITQRETYNGSDVDCPSEAQQRSFDDCTKNCYIAPGLMSDACRSKCMQDNGCKPLKFDCSRCAPGSTCDEVNKACVVAGMPPQ
jgi:hypothetical protein